MNLGKSVLESRAQPPSPGEAHRHPRGAAERVTAGGDSWEGGVQRRRWAALRWRLASNRRGGEMAIFFFDLDTVRGCGAMRGGGWVEVIYYRAPPKHPKFRSGISNPAQEARGGD